MKSNRLTHKATLNACFIGYIVQAIVNNFAPLLFLTFQSSYDIPLSQITLLITFNFGMQLLIDAASTPVVERLGYRVSVIIAHICSFAGLILLTILPEVLPSAFAGLLIAVFIYAIGGGLIEVLISPLVEACPTENKEGSMSILHSFYCWGHVGVVLISTIYFNLFGIENWKFLAIFWALIPLANCLLLGLVPIYELIEEGETSLSLIQLLKMPLFWGLLLMMICSGASEQAVLQWASTFAEAGLGVSKTIGDLAGPMAFAILMGISRSIYGKYSERLPLSTAIGACSVLCTASYLLITLSPWPILSLVGCAICGFSVGIFWPGTFSIAAKLLPTGGTLLFALMAVAGDIGCSGGPTFAGLISSALGDNLKAGILAAIIFPISLLLANYFIKKQATKS